MGTTESELEKLHAERDVLIADHSKLRKFILHVRQFGAPPEGEKYVAARTEQTVIETRIRAIDDLLTERRDTPH
ncbi:hypothetical protein ACFVUS_29820 [Nocardia sp. NPDC058058]|uniref:hypothetical protein n=1 Tax=Nocardia sp. NPDC058058 TaxID=3346317 RepID=UPI0036DC77DC